MWISWKGTYSKYDQHFNDNSSKTQIHIYIDNIYLLTGYEGIASLLSPRLWLLTEAKPRSIVRVKGTTNLLFPNTQSISILSYRKTLDSELNDHLKMIKTNKITHLLPVSEYYLMDIFMLFPVILKSLIPLKK
jgi:hypothetical protein